MIILGIIIGVCLVLTLIIARREAKDRDSFLAAVVLALLFCLLIGIAVSVGVENSSVKSRLKMMQYDIDYTCVTTKDKHEWNRFIILNRDNWIAKDTSKTKLLNVKIKEDCN